jgi:hypothetical protein
MWIVGVKCLHFQRVTVSSSIFLFFPPPTKLQDTRNTKQKTTLVRQVAFLIRVEEIGDVISKFYVISVITRIFVEEAEEKRQAGHVGVKLEIRANVTVLGEMSTCSLVFMNLHF